MICKSPENELAHIPLNDQDAAYLVPIVRDYFRTTKKAAAHLNSLFTVHAVDSLDAMEVIDNAPPHMRNCSEGAM